MANKVFVVHGRNLVARDEMHKFLRALKLEPLEWNEAARLTGKPAPTTLEIVRKGIEEADATVVLFTGDDSARLRPEYGQEPLTLQPRPNVIFEAGWALATSPEKTVLVRFGGLREFSDISGLNMIELDNSRQKREALMHRLQNAGIKPRRNGSQWLDKSVAGDFDLFMEPEEPYSDVLERGAFTQFVVDSSLSHSFSALDLEQEMVAYLTDGGSPDLKFNYLGALGAENWLNLSADPTYGHSELASAFRQHANEIADACALPDGRVDLVSLGPGDGDLDLALIAAFRRRATVAHYYPLDLSIELLQSAVKKIVKTNWLPKDFRIKAIHGDFTSLIRYKPIYCFDPAVNFMSMIGYTFGNHIEGELIGKLREGMNPGDLLLLDARLKDEGLVTRQKVTKEQREEITRSYSHGLNNRFAFGPIEATTIADMSQVTFRYDVNERFTSVPNALNIVTYVENLQTKFRRTGRKLHKRRLDLAVTTIYDEGSLSEWLIGKGFDIAWKKREKRSAFFLLRKADD
jgi:hypothetical protein